MTDLEQFNVNGLFIGETADYWIFQETNNPDGNEIWKLEKKKLRGIPKMNHEGYLTLDDSYKGEEINGEWFIVGGMGRLITFYPCPF